MLIKIEKSLKGFNKFNAFSKNRAISKKECLLCSEIIGNYSQFLQPPFSFGQGNFYLEGGFVICKGCVKKLGFLKHDKIISCRQEKEEGPLVLYLAPYGGYIKELIHEFKLGKNISLKVPLGQLLALRILLEEERLIHKESKLKLFSYVFVPLWDSFVKAIIPGLEKKSYFYDVITYVPLHEDRLYERGFDQAGLIAKEASGVVGISFRELLFRTEDTIPQGKLTRAQRVKNLKGKFQLIPEVKKETLRGKRIILVDDIFTTGASTREASRVLYEAGAGSITAVVLCR